ncbi:MFS transporter [Zhihengliuella salsuginis]|uniref:MFS transporter n=1 Tax=Zhihengliuella salsuginis TaxID=578222 RepID=A0ABQ3GIY8_9MICC|nr:MFS transporter [Zhihengliuella salsuginis]GHD04945.1 MFS transporter [Zhihengliuella salsuginis]
MSTTDRTATAQQVAAGRQPATLAMRPGRWVDNWDAEDLHFWDSVGRATAKTNLKWSIFAEFLGFVVWQLWSVTAVFLPQAGFDLTTSQLFWLISIPALVGATLRIPYTFMVARFGGRNWTVVSALLLLVPAAGLGLAVSDPTTPFSVLLLLAATAGVGGGNFASSMANITYFYPAREKGWALGLNAAGGNLGAAVVQLIVPIAVTALAATALNLPLAGWIWVPFILLAAFGARKYMHNLSHARGDISGALAALKEKHLWIISFLYIGTFGSFIGFSAVFPKLIADTFEEFSSFTILTASLSLSFLGPLVGSLSRPYGGRLADRIGGARITVACFAVMALITVAVVLTLPLRSFWLFLGLFLLLFTASGIANGSTYKMIPTVFALQSVDRADGVSAERKASAALGLISAIGAYGGFMIPQALGLSASTTGAYTAAFVGFVAAYVVMMAVTWFFYLRPGTVFARQGV